MSYIPPSYFVCELCTGEKLRKAKEEQKQMRNEIKKAKKEGKL